LKQGTFPKERGRKRKVFACKCTEATYGPENEEKIGFEAAQNNDAWGTPE